MQMRHGRKTELAQRVGFTHMGFGSVGGVYDVGRVERVGNSERQIEPLRCTSDFVALDDFLDPAAHRASLGADVARCEPSPVQMWQGEPSPNSGIESTARTPTTASGSHGVHGVSRGCTNKARGQRSLIKLEAELPSLR